MVAAFTLYLYIGGFDDVAGLSLDDADLIVELDDVPDDENAFLTFMFATNYWTPVLSRFVFSAGGWQTVFTVADLV